MYEDYCVCQIEEVVKEALVTCFKVLFHNWPRDSEETLKILKTAKI
jgi:hypothetical protein